MSLALFDLDNTLLKGDSDYNWGQFLVERGVVDRDVYEAANRKFYEQYTQGGLNIHEFAAFTFQPLIDQPMDKLLQLRQEFMVEMIEPIMLQTGRDVIAEHRQAGRTIVIITATNSFITSPIAEAFGVDHLLATDPEQVNGQYTGKIAGTPCFQDGKVKRLNDWLLEHSFYLKDSYFYSDSHNDLPLLEVVEHPVAVDPDDILLTTAQQRGWPVQTFR